MDRQVGKQAGQAGRSALPVLGDEETQPAEEATAVAAERQRAEKAERRAEAAEQRVEAAEMRAAELECRVVEAEMRAAEAETMEDQAKGWARQVGKAAKVAISQAEWAPVSKRYAVAQALDQLVIDLVSD